VVLEAQGWKNITDFVGGYIKDNPTPVKVITERTNFNFRHGEKTTWVTFDEVQKTDTEIKKLRAVRILEKTDKGFKIIYMNSYPQSNS
jgi:hypothetical protein